MRIGIRMIVAVLCAAPVAALAVPITIEFSGNVTSRIDQLGIDQGIAVGDAFSGSFTYDEAITPYSLGSELAVYLQVISAFDVNFSGASFTRAALPSGPQNPEDSSAAMNNNRSDDGADGFYFSTVLQPLPSDPADPLFHRSAFLSGVSSNQDTFADLSLPSALELSWFDQFPATFSMQYVLYDSPQGLRGFGQIDGRLTSLRTVTAVPEPAPLLLFATGLAMLLIRRRRAAPPH